MTQTHKPSILRIDASARNQGSTSRALTDALIDKLSPESVVVRDLSQPLPFVTEGWIGANFTDESDRSDEQREILALSDQLVEELVAADILVLGVPVYNFGVPAALKAWIDLIARARKTFRYTETGPVGMLTGKKAYIALASGGTEIGSEIDFASGYLRHILSFIGVEDVTFIAADQQMMKGDAAINVAQEQIEQMLVK
ncbi:NAD(P)H-dependent oxidoreductase [Parasphingorhabdus sp.]|uniref:FMN-dependent NADH-azoreductase n=1 Tax=Parasphingorhabdus sp. TaxID=2709688 RepID=UPI003264090B